MEKVPERGQPSFMKRHIKEEECNAPVTTFSQKGLAISENISTWFVDFVQQRNKVRDTRSKWLSVCKWCILDTMKPI